MDIQITDHGSIAIMIGITDRGMSWLNDNLDLDTMRWGGCGFAVEPRYVAAIVKGACEDGLEVE